ncbi:MAG: DUF551 domain-containing protein [Colwellia sp.]|nr:DUF551 domain-containing protein [Colwellia sp.]
MEWISVQDRLPCISDSGLLAVDCDKNIQIVYYESYERGTNFYIYHNGDQFTFCATHWMELPKPPK